MPGVAGVRTDRAIIAQNDRALAAWFARCRQGGTAWLWGQGLIVDVSRSIGTNDLVGDTADGLTLIVEDVQLRLDAGTVPYAMGVIQLHGNDVRVVVKGRVTIDRPFQPVAIDGDLPAQRAAHGQGYGIVIGGLGRYGAGPGGRTQTVAQNYRRGARIVCEGSLDIANMTGGLQPVYVSDDLQVVGDRRIDTRHYLSTAYEVFCCGTMGDWSGVNAQFGGDDCFFANHLATSPWARAGLQPTGGRLRDFVFSTCRGKGFGVGGHGDVEIGAGHCHANWAGGFDFEQGPYAGTTPTYAPNSQRARVFDVLVTDPGNIRFPATAGTRQSQYAEPNPGPDYAGGYLQESSGSIYVARRFAIADVTVRNPAGPAFTLDTVQGVSCRGLRASPGSTVNTYAAGVVERTARTAAQAPAVYLRNARSCQVDIELAPGPNGERFPYSFRIVGAATEALEVSSGLDDTEVDRMLIGAEVPLDQVSSSISARP